MEMLADGLSLHEVGRRIGCHASSVMRWRNRLAAYGERGLVAAAPPGRRARLDGDQEARLVQYLLVGPKRCGYQGPAWNAMLIAQLIRDAFHVSYHPDHVSRMVHDLGWIYRRPEGWVHART